MTRQDVSVAPRLTAALAGPLPHPACRLPAGRGDIERWLRARWPRTLAACGDSGSRPDNCANRFYAFGVVARPVGLATAHECPVGESPASGQQTAQGT